ncbi:hypothetical protein GN956_G7202 [Arapaima gigas]
MSSCARGGAARLCRWTGCQSPSAMGRSFSVTSMGEPTPTTGSEPASPQLVSPVDMPLPSIQLRGGLGEELHTPNDLSLLRKSCGRYPEAQESYAQCRRVVRGMHITSGH